MKKELFILFCFILSGCQIYQQPSDPNLTGGKWIFVDYEIVTISSISHTDIIKNDTICINSFDKQSYVSGEGLVSMKQNYNLTEIDRRFIRGKTVWEFDSYGHYLFCDFDNSSGSLKPNHEPFWVSYPKNYWEYESQRISIRNQYTGAITNWSFDNHIIGQGYSSKLTLVSPNIVTNLYGSNGSRDKAVTVKVILTFMR